MSKLRKFNDKFSKTVKKGHDTIDSKLQKRQRSKSVADEQAPAGCICASGAFCYHCSKNPSATSNRSRTPPPSYGASSSGPRRSSTVFQEQMNGTIICANILCGNELPEGAEFCQRCGRESNLPDDNSDNSYSPESHEQQPQPQPHHFHPQQQQRPQIPPHQQTGNPFVQPPLPEGPPPQQTQGQMYDHRAASGYERTQQGPPPQQEYEAPQVGHTGGW